MLSIKKMIGLLACLCFMESCHTQTRSVASALRTSDTNNIEHASINFIGNNKIGYAIVLRLDTTTAPFSDDYRVAIKNLNNAAIKNYKDFPLNTWIQLLNNENTDWAANLILYAIYNKDASMLSRFDSVNKWRRFMKQDDIKYWKQRLSKR